MIKMTEVLTTKEAGDRLGVNASRVRQLILAGRLHARKFGGGWIIQEKDLEAEGQ